MDFGGVVSTRNSLLPIAIRFHVPGESQKRFMPITRRSETADPIAAHILYLWRRKWSIVVPAAIAAIVTFIALEFVPAEFRVTSEVYVNHLTIGDNETPANPGAVAKLLVP